MSLSQWEESARKKGVAFLIICHDFFSQVDYPIFIMDKSELKRQLKIIKNDLFCHLIAVQKISYDNYRLVKKGSIDEQPQSRVVWQGKDLDLLFIAAPHIRQIMANCNGSFSFQLEKKNVCGWQIIDHGDLK